MQDKTVAVITSTIGRPELADAIESVLAQTYPCKHYVFVDGEMYTDKAKTILEKYPNVIATYLPMNTGANGWVNSSINAIAPFLVKEDIICYLDDDNWYEPNHIELLVKELSVPGIKFAYSLRNFYAENKQFICPDDLESLGAWSFKSNDLEDTDKTKVTLTLNDTNISLAVSGFVGRYHIDTNCYAFERETALELAKDWFTGVHNDKHILHALARLKLSGRYTGKYTVNYYANLNKMLSGSIHSLFDEYELSEEQRQFHLQELIKQLCRINIEAHNGKPWVKE